jgi:hypothetical protein
MSVVLHGRKFSSLPPKARPLLLNLADARSIVRLLGHYQVLMDTAIAAVTISDGVQTIPAYEGQLAIYRKQRDEADRLVNLLTAAAARSKGKR